MRKTSVYRPGKRSPDWLKIKARQQQEFVVCGFTEGKGSRKHFGALLLGAYRNGRLRYLSLRYRVYRKGIEGSNRSTEAVFLRTDASIFILLINETSAFRDVHGDIGPDAAPAVTPICRLFKDAGELRQGRPKKNYP